MRRIWWLVLLVACGSKDNGTDDTKKIEVSPRGEAMAMFAEIATREEQHRVDNGAYLAAPICSHPVAMCAEWTKLGIKSPIPKPVCSYTIAAGQGGTVLPPDGFKFTAPAGAWYHALAVCERGGRTFHYFISSLEPQMQTHMIYN